MTANEIRARVNGIFSASYSSQVYLVLKTDNGFVLRKADIENATEPEMRSLFADSVRFRVSDNEDLSTCNLSVADDRANALFYYDYDEYPEELSVFKGFTSLPRLMRHPTSISMRTAFLPCMDT